MTPQIFIITGLEYNPLTIRTDTMLIISIIYLTIVDRARPIGLILLYVFNISLIVNPLINSLLFNLIPH
jgi:hypothetical protein